MKMYLHLVSYCVFLFCRKFVGMLFLIYFEKCILFNSTNLLQILIELGPVLLNCLVQALGSQM